jgi:hypothetical protein
MRTRMKPGCLEVLARLLEQGCGAFRNGRVRAADQPVDVVHPESDPFEMKSRDGASKRFAFVDDVGRCRPLMPVQQGEEICDPRGRSFTIVHWSSTLLGSRNCVSRIR